MGASLANDPLMAADFSNNGEVMAPGAYIAVSGPRFIAGTSFAAPMASALAAVVASTGACNAELEFYKDQPFNNVDYITAFVCEGLDTED